MSATQKKIFTPNLQQAERFVALLAEAEPVTFQTFSDTPEAKAKKTANKADHLAQKLHGSIAGNAAKLARLNAKGAGIFVTVNATDLRGRKKDNIIRVRAVFVDLDGAPLEPVLACGLAPHVVVESSQGRWHAYWRVHGLALEQFGDVQKAIAARFTGDESICDLPRVMRLPGFWHRKGTPFLTRIIQENLVEPYTADQILAEFIPAGTVRDTPKKPVLGSDPVLKAFKERDLYIGEKRGEKGAHHVKCPWHAEHTGRDTTGTIYYEPHTGGYVHGSFKCQHAHCAERKIGDVQKFFDVSIFGPMIRRLTQPVTWIIAIYGKPVIVETSALTSYRLLNNVCVEQIGRVLPVKKDAAWREILDQLLSEAKIEEASSDESEIGMAWSLAQQWLAGNRVAARERDEILQGKPWRDEDAARVYFQLVALKRHLEMAHRCFLEPKELGRLVREHGGKNTTMALLGSTTGVWWVPTREVEQARQTQDFDVPRLPQEEI